MSKMSCKLDENISVLKFIALAHDCGAECNETLRNILSKNNISDLIDQIGKNSTCLKFVNSITSSCENMRMAQNYEIPKPEVALPTGTISSFVDRPPCELVNDVEHDKLAQNYLFVMILNTLPVYSNNSRVQNDMSSSSAHNFSKSHAQSILFRKSDSAWLQNELDFIDSAHARLQLKSNNETITEYLKYTTSKIGCTPIRRVLEYGSWLMVFMSAVENLPVCVSLSTARKDRHGFPLIYVNKHFETTSGYERSTILGLNCRFLQRDNTGVSNTEKESTDKVSVSLRNAVPVRVALTNYRRDGTPFRNLLAIKPVFDTDGVYQYVVGVQFNLYSEQESAYTLRLADSIFDLLPGVVAR